MTRREEVEAMLLHTAEADWPSADEASEYRCLSLTLADEVDAEREIVTKLLAMMNGYAVPGGKLYTSALEIAGRTE